MRRPLFIVDLSLTCHGGAHPSEPSVRVPNQDMSARRPSRRSRTPPHIVHAPCARRCIYRLFQPSAHPTATRPSSNLYPPCRWRCPRSVDILDGLVRYPSEITTTISAKASRSNTRSRGAAPEPPPKGRFSPRARTCASAAPGEPSPSLHPISRFRRRRVRPLTRPAALARTLAARLLLC